MIYQKFQEEYQGLTTELFKSDRKEYNRRVSDIGYNFHEALKKEYGTVDNPKEDLLYSKAWDRGHSAGFSEIESVYMDLVDLIL